MTLGMLQHLSVRSAEREATMPVGMLREAWSVSERHTGQPQPNALSDTILMAASCGASTYDTRPHHTVCQESV